VKRKDQERTSLNCFEHPRKKGDGRKGQKRSGETMEPGQKKNEQKGKRNISRKRMQLESVRLNFRRGGRGNELPKGVEEEGIEGSSRKTVKKKVKLTGRPWHHET